MSTLRLQSVTSGYRKKTVLKDVTLKADSGEILVLLGSNGSGKSTLLRTIQGCIPLQSGKITVDETDLSALTTKERAALVTTMAQDISAEPGLTGMDRIEMGFYPIKGLFGKLQDNDIQKIHEIAELFGITNLLHQDLAKMSVGERQMIALMRAAIQDTPILLLDEPASALDLQRTEILFSMLHKLASDGKIILMVLHDPTQALRHGDRILYLKKNPEASILQEVSNPKDISVTETMLQRIYPGLHIHTDPLFCYMETEK